MAAWSSLIPLSVSTRGAAISRSPSPPAPRRLPLPPAPRPLGEARAEAGAAAWLPRTQGIAAGADAPAQCHGSGWHRALLLRRADGAGVREAPRARALIRTGGALSRISQPRTPRYGENDEAE